MWRMPRRTKSYLTSLSVLTLSLTAFACTGVMEGQGTPGSSGGPGGPGGPGGGGSGGSSSVSTPIDMEQALTQPIDPGHVGIHRLNTAEYNNSVKDVLGTTLQPADATWRGGELGGFDNMASVLGVDPDQYQRYFDAATAVTNDAFADAAKAGKFATCATRDDACITKVVTDSGLKIFRRPLTAAEVTTYSKVYKDAQALGDDHNASVKLVVRALLSSLEFLYRIEHDDNPASTNKHPLTAYELATRLSYFLWSSSPDDALLAKAGDGSLATDAGLSAAVDTMLGNVEKSNRFVSNFAGQWLGARRVVDHPTSPEVYPSWNAEIAAGAAQEMYMYFDEFLRSGRTWLEFVQADINFVTPALAAHYGMPPVASGTVRVENVADGRKGFIGLAGFLAMSSPDRRTSPTLRGKWMLMNLMCTEFSPPANVPELDVKAGGDTTGLNIRQVLELHRADKACAACHAIIDPFGLALEKLDGIGKFRTNYPDGSLIDDSTMMAPDASTYPTGLTFAGLTGAADAVTQNPNFATCIGKKMLTYGLGRPITDTDLPYLAQVNQEWLKPDATPSIGRLIHGLVSTETFRYRRGVAQ